MAVKKMTPAPIDRPLSRAYLRQFTGWSTAYPPGQSEPNSVRVMENMMVDRNGALAVRPGLRYLSYAVSPDIDPVEPGSFGYALAYPPVGSQELFYMEDGSRALLFAVRESSGKVGWRVMLFSGQRAVVYPLDDPRIDFLIPQGESNIEFESTTSHVQYLQINNRILALSDDTDTMRVFSVGGQKIVKKLKAISVPDWDDTHKLTVVHPDAAWINSHASTTRTNLILNSSFEVGTQQWVFSKYCKANTSPEASGIAPTQGRKFLEMRSTAQRTNLQLQPLHNPASTWTTGWTPDVEHGNPQLVVAGGYMVVTAITKGLSLVNGSKMIDYVRPNKSYRVAVDYFITGEPATPVMKLSFYSANGAEIGTGSVIQMPKNATSSRFVSPPILTPAGTTAMRLSLGSIVEVKPYVYANFRNIVVCPDGEPTTMFNGGSGVDYFWTGAVNASVSIYHPPVDITIASRNRPVKAGASLYAATNFVPGSDVAIEFGIRLYDKNGYTPGFHLPPTTGNLGYSGSRYEQRIPAVPVGKVAGDLMVKFKSVARSAVVRMDTALLEPGNVDGVNSYFDGSSANSYTSSRITSAWQDPTLPHLSSSIQTTLPANPPALTAEDPTANTLIATGDSTANPYKMAFFYAFENEIGESAPSKITEVRLHRGWSNWLWKLPSATGEPTGADTTIDILCADQLVCSLPPAVYDQALAEGAIRWNLYGMAWSDQEGVPPSALLISYKDMYKDPIVDPTTGLPYEDGGRIIVTPSRTASIDDIMLPNIRNRTNFSIPPRHTNGLIAGDRMVLVGSSDDPAGILWSSNRPGEYTNFTASRGGGQKTLSSGNINLPTSVLLWQNPQSTNTITIMCEGDNGVATSYYMAPATVTQGSSGSVQIMGFEETTNTPGSVAPYGAEVLNNALYRPLDRSLLKSTASNYNISHKPMTNNIANMWTALRSKQWIMSAQLDNRLYYLVHNPLGEALQQHCKGNEIWVYDVVPEKGTWSRFLVQASALKPFKVGTNTYIGVTRPDGIYYLDPDARQDDYVDVDHKILQRPIPWRMETNTQGANRAHDAWAHLQQVMVNLGNFKGSMQYGIRGHSINGTQVDMSKIVADDAKFDTEELVWDIEDSLLVRRDLKEWYFYAGSITGKESSGLLGYVQYRYTPVSVNVGYEYGSIETFEYGRNVANGPDVYSRNGIPEPMPNFTRP